MRLFTTLILIALSIQMNAQFTVGENNLGIKNNVSFNDSARLRAFVNQKINSLQIAGYITAHAKSLEWQGKVLSVFIEKGKKYTYCNLEIDSSLSEKLLLANGTPQLMKNEFINLINYYSNIGYPFANVTINDIYQPNDSCFSGRVTFKENQKFIIDTIIIKGGAKTAKPIILKAIGIKPKSIYNESDIKLITKRLRNTPFLTPIRSPELIFSPGKAQLIVFVNDIGVNKFDGIIGLNTDEVTDNLIITGDIDLRLKNIFKRAEQINIAWQKSKTNTQNYEASVSIPYIGNSNIGVLAEANSFRQDTLFSNLNSKIGLSYKAIPNQTIGLYYARKDANKLGISSPLSASLSNIASVKSTYYGIIFTQELYDNIFNPLKGYLFTLQSDIGNKTIKETKEKLSQYIVELDAALFTPLSKQSTLFIGIKSGNIFSEQLFDNELFQIGGIKTLRGFNEQELIVSNYAIGTLEYRYLLDKTSAVFAFSDFGYIKNSKQKEDNPLSFGVGGKIGLGNGVFSLSYGLGKLNGNPILIRNGKVHFGFINTF